MIIDNQEERICQLSCINASITDRKRTGLLFVNGLGDWGSVPGQVIPKTQKNCPKCTLLNN